MALQILEVVVYLAIAYPVLKGILSIIKSAKGIKNGHS